MYPKLISLNLLVDFARDEASRASLYLYPISLWSSGKYTQDSVENLGNFLLRQQLIKIYILEAKVFTVPNRLHLAYQYAFKLNDIDYKVSMPLTQSALAKGSLSFAESMLRPSPGLANPQAQPTSIIVLSFMHRLFLLHDYSGQLPTLSIDSALEAILQCIKITRAPNAKLKYLFSKLDAILLFIYKKTHLAPLMAESNEPGVINFFQNMLPAKPAYSLKLNKWPKIKLEFLIISINCTRIMQSMIASFIKSPRYPTLGKITPLFLLTANSLSTQYKQELVNMRFFDWANLKSIIKFFGVALYGIAYMCFSLLVAKKARCFFRDPCTLVPEKAINSNNANSEHLDMAQLYLPFKNRPSQNISNQSQNLMQAPAQALAL